MSIIAWHKDLKIGDIKPGDQFIRIKLTSDKTILKLHLVDFDGKHIAGTWLMNLSEKRLKLNNQVTSNAKFQLAGLNHIRATIEKGHLNKTNEEIANAKNKKEEKTVTLKSYLIDENGIKNELKAV